MVTNSSSKDTKSITDHAGLKELYVTGMYKSLKGHQALCDVLKKQILNRNPRKEVLPLRGNSMLMGPTGNLSSIPKPHGLLRKDLS